MSYEELVERLNRIYWAPPMDVPPSCNSDYKKVCDDLRALLLEINSGKV